ncbi:MAG: DUF1697 domain-containing protein [Anaerolineales bacterium]|jgi:uncharacterized protein (DUF1697 family)|nr:DUF1697 domain-containing protein [Anaerolineales bacterium]MBX3004412.1 DUF1697 domain-containing protein [Anaerolineales bacterium]
MPAYVALLRGIAPANPNMHNVNLRGVLEQLGFENVRSVLSSGNLVFEATGRPALAQWEQRMEAAWPRQLGFEASTIIKSQTQVEALLAAQPFGKAVHSTRSYLVVTCIKPAPAALDLQLPHQPAGQPFELVYYADGMLCSIVDASKPNGAFSYWLERRYGKAVTTRTAQTLARILQKMA